MESFGRVLLPVMTPFKPNEDVNYDAYGSLIRLAIEKDYLDSVVATGTTGEFNVLTREERTECFKVALQAAGKVPVIAGTGCASTRETVELTREATRLGIGTVMVVAPYYCKPNQEQIFGHYRRVLEETDADILIYNIPIFTGINIDPATIGRLAALSRRFIGVKDEAGMNPTQLTDIYYATKDVNPEFLLYNGDDSMLIATLAQGAAGIVSGGSMLVGDRVKEVFRLYESGKVQEALGVFRFIYRIPSTFCSFNNFNVPLKYAIERVHGIEMGPCRGPLGPLGGDQKGMVDTLLAEMGLI